MASSINHWLGYLATQNTCRASTHIVKVVMSFLWTIQQLGARPFHLRAEKNAFVFMVQKQKSDAI